MKYLLILLLVGCYHLPPHENPDCGDGFVWDEFTQDCVPVDSRELIQ
jgi:hypothetical protein